MFEQPQGGSAVPAPVKPAAAPITSPTPPRPTPPVPTPSSAPAPARPKAEDIFAPLGGATPPSRPIAPPTPVVPDMQPRSNMLWIALGAFVLVALIGGGIWLTVRSSEPAPSLSIVADTETSTPANNDSEAPVETQSAPDVAAPVAQPTEAQSANTDTDRDGLSDADETSFGTDPASPDTDADGLSDSAEVRVYKTNPLDPDSDDDTFLDGAEVRAGYDPNGSGKLNDINRAMENK